MTKRATAGFLPSLIAFVVIAAGARAGADVIAPDLLSRCLSSTKELRQSSPPASLSKGRYYAIAGSGAGGFVAPEDDDYGYLKNGIDVLIVPLQSGGSGGVFFTLLFATPKSHPRFIGYIPSPSGHLSVEIVRGEIEVTTPVYAAKDASCCPSGRTVTTYSLSGIKLRQIDRSRSILH